MPSVTDYQVALTPKASSDPASEPVNNDEMRSFGEYCRTRFTTLKPPMTKVDNPFTVLAQLNRMQWLQFLTFGKTKTQITWGITLVLMLRSVGSIIFGIASDCYGRKVPFIVNNLLFMVLELATGFCQNYTQFLIVRALFGIAMGGLYGNVAATALEDCPPAARGIVSGMMQQGYAFGYLLAVVHGWRPLFWFGACPPVFIIIFRLYLPETKVFQERQRVREASRDMTKTFIAEGKIALKRHWLLLCYMVLLMAGFNFMSHGSQDLYPTMLENQFEFNSNQVTVTQVVANLGAICGGTVVGYYSQVFGRRLSILVMAVVGAALLYPYCYVSDEKIMIAAFFEQFCVQGAWGVIPIHLMELSPPSYSAFVVGTAYQLGNLVSSASSTIESSLGEHFPLPDGENGVARYQYGKVICIFLGVVYVYVFLLTLIGPEARGKEFDVKHDHDLEEAAHVNHEDLERIIHGDDMTPTGAKSMKV
ncbi:hypothetical protein PHYSODRAFT_316090 [Phytophthora sojae]|uniref:Major facilitator superfamily (MFS) profile domain-containing protein n=1 Tax=Phytophthora sojae (strain P6497) TaxID=1094619 RepID=G4ZLC3_PHYSP|nr:hypothetical protein PHYSODRAFT_316090 [Phytophthora sojae]EGZ15969.1 hypothetical protein PHYSODRAFT_316090 [Phytophthora sojae]|eukprot:XP_009529718.1 hypothetical protein PHYSODRAFT_316090 [Phytophthora sojae]